MQIVAVQLDMTWEDKNANHAKVRRLLASTAIARGALIVLPEMFDTGFSMNVNATAQTEARESEQFLRSLAQEYQSAVLAGVVGPVVGGQASNEAVAVAPNATELVRYRKVQPFTLSGEDQFYGSGSGHRLFTWEGVVVAPFICYDLRFPELFRAAAFDGAELMVIIASWPSKRSEHWVRLTQARAIENQAFAIAVNRCGADPALEYDGRTVAFNPMGECLFEADASEQVRLLDIAIEEARRWREKFPALQDARRPG